MAAIMSSSNQIPSEIPAASRSLSAPSALTQVELMWDEGKVERWIAFGRPVDDRIIDRQRRVLFFAPTSVFAFVRWQSNAYGTVLSRIDILRALEPHEAMTSIGFCVPAAKSFCACPAGPRCSACCN